jgi:caa(3)-type oxidase subunit IV
MNTTAVDGMTDVRRSLTLLVAQLALTGAAVLVSRMELGVRIGMAAVMLIAAVNGLMVAVFLMGIRRDGRLVTLLALGTLVLIAGLLVWPAWDVSQRVRLF